MSTTFFYILTSDNTQKNYQKYELLQRKNQRN